MSSLSRAQLDLLADFCDPRAQVFVWPMSVLRSGSRRIGGFVVLGPKAPHILSLDARFLPVGELLRGGCRASMEQEAAAHCAWVPPSIRREVRDALRERLLLELVPVH